MPKVGEPYRLNYIAKGFEGGLADVKGVVYKPDGNKQGVYNFTELNQGDGRGIYYFDYVDSDIEGTYLFVVNSLSHPKKDARQVYFEKRVWSESEKKQIRDALGVDGDKIESVGGKIHNMIATLEFIKDIEGGMWEIENNQMIFYKSDNITEVARFDLFDEGGQPTEVFPTKRERV